MGLIRILIIAAVAGVIVLLFKRMFKPSLRPQEDVMEDERLGRLVQDPNCGIYVDGKVAISRKVPDGELFFCSKKCEKAHFAKYPTGHPKEDPPEENAGSETEKEKSSETASKNE